MRTFLRMPLTPSILLIIPTQFEWRGIFPEREAPETPAVLTEVSPNICATWCGLGVVASTLFTEVALNSFRERYQQLPAWTILLGIAGSFDPSVPKGTLYRGSAVSLHGIGVGEGRSFRSPEELGWSQDSLAEKEGWLTIPTDNSCALPTAKILTVCSGSDAPETAAIRKSRYPSAHLEEMEGFSFVLACKRNAANFHIIRAVSNTVGERDPSQWNTEIALKNLREYLSALS
ncbi:hypothetical protein MRY87_13095 [bacterium]|nr:hypothetical protein [bacterium]